MTTEDRIRDFIVEEVNRGVSRHELTSDRELIRERILDSLGIFELITFIESDLRVEIADDDLVFENFATIEAIARLIASKSTRTSA